MRRSFFQNLIRVNWLTIERLDKLILKVSNIFFFFLQCFFLWPTTSLNPTPALHFKETRQSSPSRISRISSCPRIERNKGSNRLNAPLSKIGRPSYECVIRVNFRGLQLVDTRIMKTLFVDSIPHFSKSRKFLKNSSSFLTFQNS